MEQKEKFTGRMLIDLSKSYPRKMEYEWIGEESSSEKIVSKPFIKRENVFKNQEDFFSEVVEEFLPRGIIFFELIDNYFFARNMAFDDKECIQLIQRKIEEGKNYSKSVYIIDVDSIIKLNKSISKSESSPSDNLSIDRSNLYREIINIATKVR